MFNCYVSSPEGSNNNNIIYIYMQYTSMYYIHDYATIMPGCIYTCNVHRTKTRILMNEEDFDVFF